ncbi:hypothetical protein ACFRCG_37945, partial [Embleya sp. NPDC056575]
RWAGVERRAARGGVDAGEVFGIAWAVVCRRWLAGYRHPRNGGRPDLMSSVLDAFTQARPLIEGVEAVGDPIEVLPCAFHALWHGRLTASLDEPLHERVLVGPGGPSLGGHDVRGGGKDEDEDDVVGGEDAGAGRGGDEE